MSFFQSLFPTAKPSRSALLIDIDASSVAGAYVQYADGEKSKILYTQTLPIETRTHESHEEAMVRTLLALGNTLRGRVDRILVSVHAPWAEVEMRTKHLHPKDPFIFTRELVAEALEDNPASEKLLADESIVGTILNGYETREPYGQNAHRASITTLASHLDQTVSDSIVATLRSLFHTDRISLIARDSLRYQAMCAAFSHERSACILDATDSPHFFVFIHKDIPVALKNISDANAVFEEIQTLTQRFSPPRTLFVLAGQLEDASLQQTLRAAQPDLLTIVSVRPHHLTSFITHAAPTPPDISLLLMALFTAHPYVPRF